MNANEIARNPEARPTATRGSGPSDKALRSRAVKPPSRANSPPGLDVGLRKRLRDALQGPIETAVGRLPRGYANWSLFSLSIGMAKEPEQVLLGLASLGSHGGRTVFGGAGRPVWCGRPALLYGSLRRCGRTSSIPPPPGGATSNRGSGCRRPWRGRRRIAPVEVTSAVDRPRAYRELPDLEG